MNWFDGVLIVLILLLAFAGFRIGLIRAFFLVVGLLVAAILAAQISGPIASALTDGLHSESIASVAAYGIVFSIVMIAFSMAGLFAAKFARLLFLGPVDSILGAVLGALAAFILGAAIVAAMARFAFIVPSTTVEQVGVKLGEIDSRGKMRDALVDSSMAGMYVHVRDKLPAKTLGMIPADYNLAMEALKQTRESN